MKTLPNYDKKLYELRSLDGALLAKGSYKFCANRASKYDTGFRIDQYWEIEESEDLKRGVFTKQSFTDKIVNWLFVAVLSSILVILSGLFMVGVWHLGWNFYNWMLS